jgi:hypothetical protein
MQEKVVVPDNTLSQFKERMEHLEGELRAINTELGEIDLTAISSRTRELLRRTRGLLEGNTTILFEGQPARISEELYRYLEFADGHLNKALQDEYDFEVIKKRLFISTTLAEYVIRQVQAAATHLEDQERMRGA